MFEGSYVALVTPFDSKGDLDEGKLTELVEFQVKNGTSGIMPCGTTGESATLSHEEHERVIDLVVKAAAGRVKVVPGTGSNCTEEAVMLTKYARKVKADGAMLISPYYNKPTQKGLYLHFKAVADEVGIPLMIYNIQSRTGVNIEPETFAKLAADCPNIVAVKEASGSLDQMSRIRQLCPRLEVSSGDDSLTLPLLAIGGVGVVSVAANIIPKDVSDMVSSYRKGDTKTAMELHFKMLSIMKVLFIETNPIPVKTAMEMMGLCSGSLRLPMCGMEEANKDRLRKALSDYGLIKK